MKQQEQDINDLAFEASEREFPASLRECVDANERAPSKIGNEAAKNMRYARYRAHAIS